jgi:hypothetical protein
LIYRKQTHQENDAEDKYSFFPAQNVPSPDDVFVIVLNTGRHRRCQEKSDRKTPSRHTGHVLGLLNCAQIDMDKLDFY